MTLVQAKGDSVGGFAVKMGTTEDLMFRFVATDDSLLRDVHNEIIDRLASAKPGVKLSTARVYTKKPGVSKTYIQSNVSAERK